MKTWFNKLFFISLAPLIMWSCKKEENKVYLENGKTQSLSVSSTTLVLDPAKASAESIIFAWDAVQYGYPAGSSYTLQFDKAGGTFASPVKSENIGTERKKSYTTGDLNKLLLLSGFPAGSASQVLVRVKSEITGVSTVAPQYSNVVTLTITPYLVKVEYPSLYVPGNYQGWAPDKAKKIAAFNASNDKFYEGYVYFSIDNNEFKFTDAPNWNNGIFGDNGDGTTGIIQSPGNNIKVATSGYYWLKCDLKNKTWTATRTEWGIIGSSIPPYDWSTDVNMTLDQNTGIWSVTGDFKAGDYKFRANDKWDINYGDKDSDGILDFNAANLKLAADGKYKIELDLTDAGNYTFKVTKL
ncbi:MAG: SusE domain-containing protein [Sphingobacteriales bacterium]|nr:SusE domain-containing protein [Sphingobacteriales bacterium]